MLDRAWDDPAARWNADLDSFAPGAEEPDSPWWMHDEADQTLAALDLREDFARSDWLARSAQGYLDVFVDPAYPHEVWQRPRAGPALANLEKSGRGKNMYHAFEHTLVMYLHGRAMEGAPGRAPLRAARGPGAHGGGGAVLVRRHDRAPRRRRPRGPAARAPARDGRAVGARRGPRPATTRRPTDDVPPTTVATLDPARERRRVEPGPGLADAAGDRRGRGRARGAGAGAGPHRRGRPRRRGSRRARS